MYCRNLRDIFQSCLSTGFPPTPLTTTTSSQGTGTGSSQPVSSLASLLISADSEQESNEQTGILDTLNEAPHMTAFGTTAPPRAETGSGMITPEEISNITSSDAATVHSSASG